ncbi:hypothetical protein TI04_08165 [Achromatium sp. WMS2]|nr:hypothetical protein TI04_08165 [Achromatium sp. WMS2]
MSTPITVTVITRDATATLERCLKSATWADEILVIDSGSTDNTVSMAQGLASRVEYHPWSGYGAQKRYAVEIARHDWILSIDADEWLSDELAVAIQNLFTNGNPANSGYTMNCRNRFLGRWLWYGEGYPDPHLRLFNRKYGNWQDRPVHEQVIVSGNTGWIKGDLCHESASSLLNYLAKQNHYTQLQAEIMWQNGKHAHMFNLIINPLWRFIRMYILKLGFLDGIPGLVHISIGCFNTFIKYAKLWELGKMKP